MNQVSIFDSETILPDESLTARQKTLLGFQERYSRVHDQLHLLLNLGELGRWNKEHHGGKLTLCSHLAEQYPFVIFYGDVGTGKTATAECISNLIVSEAHAEDSILFKLSSRVRGSGKVGEMGTLITEAFQKVSKSAGKGRRAILIIDEGDSLAAARSQEHSHHEDKVAVNTLIQCIDELRKFEGRVLVFLCTNRLSALDAALRRRAAIVEEFRRPDANERRQLFNMDLTGLGLSDAQITELVSLTDSQDGLPGWTYSDIRTRLYPNALAMAFPDKPLQFVHFKTALEGMHPSPVMEDR